MRPTLLPGVPRIFEKVHDATRSAFEQQTGAKRALVGWALRVGRRASVLRRDGKRLPPGLALQHRLAGRLVYSKFKQRLGDGFASPSRAPLRSRSRSPSSSTLSTC